MESLGRSGNSKKAQSKNKQQKADIYEEDKNSTSEDSSVIGRHLTNIELI